MPKNKFPDTGLRKSYAEKNQQHLGIGHLPYSAHRKTYTSNRTGASTTSRPSYFNRNVNYRSDSQNLRTGEGIRERGSIGVMNAAHASSFAKGLKSYGKGFRKAVKGQVKSEKLIDKGTRKLQKIQSRFSPKLKKAYGAYVSAVMNPGSVSEKKLKKLQKKATRVGKRFDKRMTNVSTRIGDKAYKKKLQSFAKGAKGFQSFKKEAGTAPTDHLGRPTHTNPVYASYKEFDRSSQKVASLKANKQSSIAGNYIANLNKARNISFDKVRSFSTNHNAFNVRKINKAQNSVAVKYKRKTNPGYGTFGM